MLADILEAKLMMGRNNKNISIVFFMLLPLVVVVNSKYLAQELPTNHHRCYSRPRLLFLDKASLLFSHFSSNEYLQQTNHQNLLRYEKLRFARCHSKVVLFDVQILVY